MIESEIKLKDLRLTYYNKKIHIDMFPTKK